MKQITIKASDGYLLSALFGSPQKNIKGVIVLSSATCTKKEFYLNFAKFLLKQDYCVLLYDYRGIGDSAPENLKKSNIYMHEWGTLDMNAVLDYLVEDMHYTDIIWLGHSIGAQLVGFLKNQQHVKKVISINAALGYWGYFPYPMKASIWALWYVIGPILIKVSGFGYMKLIGWGENLPKNAILEWRAWCMSKTYYMDFLKKELGTDRFYGFKIPITALYISDDYIANDRTASLMLKFFPDAPVHLSKIDVTDYTDQKVGHVGIFRKRFEESLWPLLMLSIKNEP